MFRLARAHCFLWFSASSLVLFGACKEDPKGEPSTDEKSPTGVSRPSSAAAEAEASAKRLAAAESIMNPSGLEPYAGPTGRLRGVVRAAGEPPSPSPEQLLKGLPSTGCEKAREMYGRRFRVASDGGLADVLVAVTGYDGYLRPRSEAVRVEMSGCAFDRRTVVLTPGQRIEVYNLDNEPYLPKLIGLRSHTLRVAMPQGAPVPIFVPIEAPRRYALGEQTRPYMLANVFVVPYTTATVTAPDGSFSFEGLPVGKVHLTAFLPTTGEKSEMEVEIEADRVKQVSLELSFTDKAAEPPTSSQ